MAGWQSTGAAACKPSCPAGVDPNRTCAATNPRMWLRTFFVVMAAGLGCTVGCGKHRDCSNRACRCPAHDDCELTCHAPPCNVTCGEGARCDATCANGSCTCERGARCAFECGAPPCHVRCEGDHAQCDGTCANGTCRCGVDSSCEFTCQSGPCHTECPRGASCVVRCPHAPAGTQDCDIIECWTGAPTLCEGLEATVCNASCPNTADQR